MKIIRVTNPEISIPLLPWFAEAEGELSREECVKGLQILMTEMSEETCVLVATDKQYMKGFVVGYIEKDGGLWIWQAKKSKDMRNFQLLIHKLYTWARTMGAKKATLGSDDKRLRRLYKRKYGYTPIGGNLMEKAI